MLYARRALALFASLAFLSCGESISGPEAPTPNVPPTGLDDKGDLEMIIVTDDHRLEPDGYDLRIDDRDVMRVEANGAVTLAGVAAGSHSIELSDLADGCQVEGWNPRVVAVEAGGLTQVTFNVYCSWRDPVRLEW